jgi:SnoaL-like domain
MTDRADELAALLDKQAIYEVLVRYCRAIDRLDRELLTTVYHPDAWDDHGTFRAGAADAIEELVRRVRTLSKSSMHSITNVLIDLKGDSARSEAHFIAWMRFDRGEREFIRALGGRYLDSFERRAGEWRIANRVVVQEWCRIDPVTEEWKSLPLFHRGQRSRDDLVYSPDLPRRPEFRGETV